MTAARPHDERGAVGGQGRLGLAAPPPPSTGGHLLDALLGFFARLREAGVAVSMAEQLDALVALGHVDLAERSQVKAALAATVVKRSEHRRVFDALFEVYFGRRSLAGPAPSPPGPGGAEAWERDLLGGLRHGDHDDLRALAARAVESFGGLDGQPGASERYVVSRVARRLDLSRLLQKALLDARDDARAPAPTDLAARLAEFRALLLEQARASLAERRGAEEVARDLLERRVEDADLLGATALELAELRRAVRPLARSLAAKLARRRRVTRRGRVDVRRTVRRSLSSGGVPLDVAHRRPRESRPDLFVLCDVSGSMAEFAKFTLSLLHALAAEFAALRSFVFVDGVDEVTGLVDGAGDGLVDVRHLLAYTKAVHDDGRSDYGHALCAFWERYGSSLSARSTVVIAGDARTNRREPGAEWVEAVSRRARRTYWLNPEPRAEWDTADSAISAYAAHCDGVFEVRNLRQLAECVLAIA